MRVFVSELNEPYSVPGECSCYGRLLRPGRSGGENRWGRAFPHPAGEALGSTQPPTQRLPVFFRVVNQPECGVNHPHPYKAEVKAIVEQNLYLDFMACYRVTLTF